MKGASERVLSVSERRTGISRDQALSVRCDGDGVAALVCQRTPQTVSLNFRETGKNLSG